MIVQEVPAAVLIKRLSDELKKLKELTPPSWSHFVKTGAHKERPPQLFDWWHTRAASIMRRIYIGSPVGISRLRTFYGGRKNRGQAPDHFSRGGGKIIRVALQQLESAGLVSKLERRGRKLTPKGIAMIERIAQQIKSETQS